MSRKSNQVQLISHMDRSIYRDNSFAGRVFIVTGGGSGIGLAIARELLVLGARCVIAGRNQNRLNQAVSECKCERLTAIRCNVRVEADVKALMRSVVDQFGRIDGLVCAAGGQFPSPAENISSKGWHAVIETNLTGSFMCAREVFAAWMETHGGSIVFITAEVDNGFPGMSHTGAARAGVQNLAKSLAVEWAPKGVRVNACAPGLVLSSGLDQYTPEFRQRIITNIHQHLPFKRLASVDEISSAVVYLLSPGAAYVSGHVLKVDGASSSWGAQKWEIAEHSAMPIYQRSKL